MYGSRYRYIRNGVTTKAVVCVWVSKNSDYEKPYTKDKVIGTWEADIM
ncbi:hypothetical protein [Clostridium tagluense]|nr:hypothetical protein [Clostridium tagluense]MBU3129708.1 hypothetical protein [Clostridium tagluense]